MRDLPWFADPSRLAAPEDDQVVLPEGATELDFFEAVYRNPNLSMALRLKAARERAQYTHPKLQAVAHGHFKGEDFARRLDRAIERSGIKAQPK